MIETTALHNLLNRVKKFLAAAHEETERNYLLIHTEEKYSLRNIHMLYYIDI